MFKRAIDLTLAVPLLVLSVPVLILAAIVIKLDSSGPILFSQTRMGRGFKPFQLLKLRTMRQGCEGPAFTVSRDPRITTPGRWLRHYKIDELPQLWNVVRGEMSLVGPRPVMPEIAFDFAAEYARLLKARPGLTDPASLKYCNEAEILTSVRNPRRYFDTVATPHKIRISESYLRRANLWSDLLIVFQTAVALLVPPVRKRFSCDLPVEFIAPAHTVALSRPGPAHRAAQAHPPLARVETFKIPAGVIERSRPVATLAKSGSLRA